MATYNPRAGMPKRKSVKCYGSTAVSKTASAGSTPATDAILRDGVPGKSCPPGMPGDPNIYPLDSNALRGWLLGYMDSIGDQLPDLAQWRRIREEVGRSVVAKEPETEEPSAGEELAASEDEAFRMWMKCLEAKMLCGND